MDEKEYRTLLLEQYKIMVASTINVTDQRQKANAFFLTIVTTLITVSVLAGKALEFSELSIAVVVALTCLNIIIIDFWKRIIVSYGKLNKGKFALIFELEIKLKANLFEREWEILTNKDNINYEPNTQTESKVVRIFEIFVTLMLLVEIGIILYKIYNNFFCCRAFGYPL